MPLLSEFMHNAQPATVYQTLEQQRPGFRSFFQTQQMPPLFRAMQNAMPDFSFQKPEQNTMAQMTQQVVTAPGEIDSILQEAAKETGVDVNILRAIAKQESDFNPNVRSSAGAVGVMQLMPDTAREMGVTNPLDPRQNIMGGARYYAKMLQMFGGDHRLALAAYNAGPGNVKKYGGIPPFKETQNYVPKVMGYAGMK